MTWCQIPLQIGQIQNTLSLEDLAEYLHSFTRLSVHDVFVLFAHVALA